MTIQAIETSYKGYRFRSRLEARWAVFFDNAGLEFVYEPEGFLLPSLDTVYLPDFWLPSIDPEHRPGSGYWIEIKPTFPPDAIAIEKMRELCVSTEHNGYIFCGLPREKPWIFLHRSGACRRGSDIVEDGVDGMFGIIPPFFFVEWGPLYRAIDCAKAARFEHGECGARA